MAVGESCFGVGTSSANTHWDVMCSVTALSSAASEWFLILLLFIHGLLSYIVSEFARYCKLPTPCLLCSRLDHYFSSKVPETYQSIFCKNHGLEIFSHGMCDDCLFSWAAKENSITESNRLLLNKMSKSLVQPNQHINGCIEQSAFGSVDRRACARCGKIWTSRQIQRRAIRYRSPVRGLSKPNIPLPDEPSQKNSNYRVNMRRKREKSYGSLYSNHLWNNMMDPPANTGYRVVKITSDSEFVAPFSDGGDGRIMVMKAKIVRQDNELRNTSQSLADAQSNILAHLKPSSKMCTPANLGADEGAKDIKMSAGVRHSSPPALPELRSLYDNPHTSNHLNDGLPCEATSKDSSETSLTLTSTPVIPLDIISLDVPSSSTKYIELPVKESPEKSYINGVNNELVEHVDTLSVTFTSVEDKFDDAAPSVAKEHAASHGSPSFSDGSKGLQTSTLVVKDKTMKIRNGAEEESQLSSTNEEYAHETENQSNNTNQRSQGDNENSNFDITRNSGECMTPREADSFDRNESAFASTAGSVVSDREGESLVDKLKRQIEYDKERIASLYKELDEERSASTIAANQAMAMITRLQEEKAALNMEALHYLRMMEEQAEYDVEALEKANDVLSEKEKEIQDLEAELEHYKSKVCDGSIKQQNCEMIKNIESDEKLKDQKHQKHSNVHEFEEKLYISDCLKKLEQKLLKFIGFGGTALMSNCVNSEMMEDRELNGSQPGDYYEDNGLCNQKEFHMSNGNSKIVELKEQKILKSEASDKHNGSEEIQTDYECLPRESHQMGHEGFLIIQEIAHQLQELRKIVLNECYVVP